MLSARQRGTKKGIGDSPDLKPRRVGVLVIKNRPRKDGLFLPLQEQSCMRRFNNLARKREEICYPEIVHRSVSTIQ